MTLRLVQLRHPQEGRRIALVEGDRLSLLQRFDSIYSLASSALLERWLARVVSVASVDELLRARRIAQAEVNILGISSHLDEARGLADIRVTLKVSDFEQLSQLLAKLDTVPGVQDARRLG